MLNQTMSRKAGSASGGKKIIICLSFVLLLNGCGSNLPNNQPEVIMNTNNNERSVEQVPALATEQLQQKLTEFYQIYNDKKFSDLSKYLAPQLEQYISLKNTTAGAIIADAKKFFADKQNVKYQPFLSAMEVNANNVRFGLNMQWNFVLNQEDSRGNYAEFSNNVYVVVNIDFNQELKIKKYTEEYIVRPEYKLLAKQALEENIDDQRHENSPQIKVPANTIVQSDFLTRRYETPFSSWTYIEKKVNYQGKKYWLTSYEFHEAEPFENGTNYLESLSIEVPAQYKKYFASYYYIENNNNKYYLKTLNTNNFEFKDVYTFLSSDGDIFELGRIFANKIIEITATWAPSGPIENRYLDLKNNEFLPLKFPKGITLLNDKFYFLQSFSPPFNILYYYGEEVDHGGYYNQLRLIDLTNNQIKDIYSADYGILEVKAVNDDNIILKETMFDKNISLNPQSTKEEIAKVFLGEKDVVIQLEN